jgi:hypothetical protein
VGNASPVKAKISIERMISLETPVNAPFKEKVRIEIAKLKEMTFKKKVEYIWEYYKLHIIGLIIILGIIGSLMNTWFFNPNPDSALFVAWSSGFTLHEQLDDLKDVLEERIVDENVNEEVVVSMFVGANSDDASMMMAYTQRLMAMVAAGAIDVFIIDAQQMEMYSNSGILRPMEDMLARVHSINPAVYELIEENKVSLRYEPEEGVFLENIMGISIIGSPLLSRLEFFEQELYFGISASARNIDNAIEALIMFFE